MSDSIDVRFRQYLEDRLHWFFTEQQQGVDIPPALLFRIEGVIESGLALGLCDRDWVRDRLCSLAGQYLGDSIACRYHEDERLILHSAMPTAPVYPSANHSNS